MKNIQFILISFFLVFTSYAQNPHNGVYYGVQNRNVYINDIIDYYDEGYYMQNTIASTFNQMALSGLTLLPSALYWQGLHRIPSANPADPDMP